MNKLPEMEIRGMFHEDQPPFSDQLVPENFFPPALQPLTDPDAMSLRNEQRNHFKRGRLIRGRKVYCIKTQNKQFTIFAEFDQYNNVIDRKGTT